MIDVSHLCNIEAEQALLGAVLISAKVLENLPRIDGGDFFEPLHGQIFEAMRGLYNEGRPITPITLMPGFVNAEPVGELSVAQYLGRLAASAATTINAPSYAAVICDFSARRALAEAGTRIAQFAGSQETAVADIGAKAVADLDGILTRARTGRKTYASGGQWAAQLVRAVQSGKGQRPIQTGFIDLDNAIGGGLRQGEAYILAGRPSMGKTAVISEILLNAAKAGFRADMFSLEMKAEDGIMARIMSSRLYNRDSPIPYLSILRHLSQPERGILTAHDISRMDEAAAFFQTLPFGIDEQPRLTVAEIVARARQLGSQLIIIDHMGKVKATSRYTGSKKDEVGEISGALADAAKTLNAAILTACQLNRANEGSENKRAGLANLRDSGEIEQDADGVFFVYRHAYYLERSRENTLDGESARSEDLAACRHDFEITIGKQRNGPCITVDLWADMANNAIRNKLK